MLKFTIKDFNKLYKTDDDCLLEIFQNRYGHLKDCPSCHKRTNFYKVSKRKCFACQFCGYQLHPLSNTIFHKSDTPLKTWFFAIYLFASSRNGVSATELQRILGVTYKCAWRMAKQIRLLFGPQGPDKFTKTMEADETYIGGRKKGQGRGPYASKKNIVIGLVERGGAVRAKVASNVNAFTLNQFILKNSKEGGRLITDDLVSYRHIGNYYKHDSINHSEKRYVRGDVHTNTIEGFWSQLKRSINGTYHAVSPKYLQSYVDEFAYRYSLRKHPVSLFYPMIRAVVKPV